MAGIRGRSGRKKKPTELKVIQGTFRKDRDGNKKKKTVNAKLLASLTPPAYLSGKYAKKVWEQYAPELAAIGMLKAMDELALAAFCESTSEWMEAEKAKKKEGLIVRARNSQGIFVQKKNPHIEIANTAKRQMLSFMSEFGMTPSSRTRLSIKQPEKEDNPFDEFLRH